MKTYWELKEEIEQLREDPDRPLGGVDHPKHHLTMMTHDGEQTHIITGMKHTEKDAIKVRQAVLHATAKHAKVHHREIRKHHDIMSDQGYGDHHYMRHEPVKKGTKSDDFAGRGGHGDVHHHKDLAAYVHHHAKADAEEYKNRHDMYDKGTKPFEHEPDTGGSWTSDEHKPHAGGLHSK